MLSQSCQALPSSRASPIFQIFVNGGTPLSVSKSCIYFWIINYPKLIGSNTKDLSLHLVPESHGSGGHVAGWLLLRVSCEAATTGTLGEAKRICFQGHSLGCWQEVSVPRLGWVGGSLHGAGHEVMKERDGHHRALYNPMWKSQKITCRYQVSPRHCARGPARVGIPGQEDLGGPSSA